jgi:hypothetical protein
MARREVISYELVDDDDGRPGAVPVVIGIGDEVYAADLHPGRLVGVNDIFNLMRHCGRRYPALGEPTPPANRTDPPKAAEPEPEATPHPLKPSDRHRPAPDAAAVRAWERENEIPVKDTGRIDGRITEAYFRCVVEGNPNYLESVRAHPDFRPQGQPDRTAGNSPVR